MEVGPWAYDNHPFLFERVKQGDDLEKTELNAITLWTQIHDLPTGFMSESVAKCIGERVGKLIEGDPNNFSGPKREYLRVRVKMDVHKALKKQLCLKRGKGGDGAWVTIRYERLPTFCFQCGILGHGENFCQLNYNNPDGISVRNFGPELRAQPRKYR